MAYGTRNAKKPLKKSISICKIHFYRCLPFLTDRWFYICEQPKKQWDVYLGNMMSLVKKKRAIYYLSKKFTDYESRLQWYISFIVHLYGLQNDFDSTCYITLHDWFQNWINTNSFISKNTKKNSRISFNIGLYTYTVRYKPNIKNTWFFMKLQII